MLQGLAADRLFGFCLAQLSEFSLDSFFCGGCRANYRPQFPGLPAGTPFADIPEDWGCPDCAVREKVDFITTSGDDAAAQAGEKEPDNWIGVNR